MKYLYWLWIRWFFCSLLIGWGTNAQLRAQQPNTDQQRYVGLQLLNLDRDPNSGLDIIDKSVGFGCNLVVITIFWERVYPTATSTPDWRQPDQQIALALRLGAKVALRVMVGRSNRLISGFWTSKECMHDDQGRQLFGIYDLTAFSYAHEPTAQKAQKFIQEACQRYNYVQNQGKMLYVSFVSIPGQESGNNFENWPNGDFDKKYVSSFDYSNAMTEGFYSWALKKYKRLAKLNYVWKTRIASENELYAPTDWYSPRNIYKKTQGKDWYVYTHQVLKKYIDQTIAGIKNVNPDYKIVNDYGAVSDDISMLRTTLGFKDLDQKADGTKVNDDPYNFNHGWTIDVVRSNRPNKWVLNEVFYTPDTPQQLLIKQFDDCFRHGCKVVTMVISTVDDATKTIIGPVANRWLRNPNTAVKTEASYQYSISQVLDSTETKSFIKEYERIAGKTNPKIVDVQVIEDILMDSYWKDLLTNVPPVVNFALTDRASKPRKAYSYALPKDLFTDPDGNIIKIEAIEKPTWLNFEKGVLSGIVPNQLAEHKITLQATDDDGATIKTNFLLKIVNSNVKPVVRRPIPNFDSYWQQLIFYQFQGDHFDDPDGNIVKIEAISGLRPWMTYTPAEFSAFPQEFGIFPIKIRAYDDDSAFVETSFYVRVINRPPVVVKVLPEKVIAQGKLFKYRISKDIFSDTDGGITSLKVLNRPSWLDFDGSELRGTPPQIDSYRLIVRAFDNAGDSVQTDFYLRVATSASLNVAPVVKLKIPDFVVFVTQKFSYKIPDSLFNDSDGYIDRIETPNLPSWLNFKNNEINGLATKIGKYTIALRGVDNDEVPVSTSFQIEIRYAQLNLELVQAGRVGTRKLIGILQDGDVLQAATLPERLTIYANSDLPPRKITFQLQGPYRKNLTVEKFPFSLFDDETGFLPVAGNYKLQVEAFGDSLKISEKTVNFTIQTNQKFADWEVYPNPFIDVCNIKLPVSLSPNALTFRLINLIGQPIRLQKSQVFVSDQVAYLDLSATQLPTGTYFLQVFQNDSLEKVVKVVKF